jgi:2-polyprenyl-3-methyl-5-hydroxy-6-metoxy-1,4-benzoquinol methylase
MIVIGHSRSSLRYWVDQAVQETGRKTVESQLAKHSREVEAGERFRFGENWSRFLALLDAERIAAAEKSLQQMLEVTSLDGRGFLDLGCGSGLFSLAARRLGARTVHSVDFDPASVACAEELRRRFFPDDESWTIEEGSVLDAKYLKSLPKFDVVYSWGVVHHTGDMWAALANVCIPLAASGDLFIGIYNDRGLRSVAWRRIKRLYCSGPLGRAAVVSVCIPLFVLMALASDLLRMRNPLRRYVENRRRRGMSVTRDWFDWLGGYPFEFAKPEEIFDFLRNRGFTLRRLTTSNSSQGINEFVFRRAAAAKM